MIFAPVRLINWYEFSPLYGRCDAEAEQDDRLCGVGLVTSHRGANGGYSVDRTAEQVTVADIVQAIDGPIALTACVDDSDGQCEVSNSCPISGNWNRVNLAVRRALEDVTLADLLDPTEMFPLQPAAAGLRQPVTADG